MPAVAQLPAPETIRNVMVLRHASSLEPHQVSYTVTRTDKNADSTLVLFPPGGYTAMRTLGCFGAMDFSGHVARLASSVRQIRFPKIASSSPEDTLNARNEDREVVAGLTPFRDESRLKSMAVELVCKGLRAYYSQIVPSMSDEEVLEYSAQTRTTWARPALHEVKITLLCTWDPKERTPIFLAHLESLKEPTVKRIKVRVQGAPRKHASAKDSQWIRHRREILNSLPPDTNEALLLDNATQNLYEGLSSNFFAFDRASQTLITAPLGSVLQGTILKVVLAVCEQRAIPVKFEFPNLRNVKEWEGAFITSTSRLVLPIETMTLPDGSAISFGDSPAIDSIRSLVLEECRKRIEVLLNCPLAPS